MSDKGAQQDDRELDTESKVLRQTKACRLTAHIDAEEIGLEHETWDLIEEVWAPSYDDWGKVDLSHEEFDALAGAVASFRARHHS